MFRSVAWLAATLAVLGVAIQPAYAAGASTVKPYIVLVLDVSGSMSDPTNSGPPSCPGTTDTKLDHAKCAIQKISQSYGEMVMALGRFHQSSSDNDCSNGCSLSGIDCTNCDESTGGNCPAANGDQLDILVPLLDGNQATIENWTDFACGQCTTTGAEPEVIAGGWTPIAGSLVGAKRYLQGLSSPSNGAYWTGAGADPIRNDPLKNVFLPNGQQCRPYITIMLTDGDETCSQFVNATNAATALLTTTVDSKNYRVVTKPIGFGKTPGDAEIEALAHAGGAADVAGNEGAYAQNEGELELAISRIIADALKFESCNNLDDDCDLLIDEDFPQKGTVCSDAGIGICKGSGALVCDAQGTGVTCQITTPGGTASTEACNMLDDDCDGFIDEGACTSCGAVELCNNMDDDCDGKTDEGLVRDCGIDVGDCVKGTESCAAGAWVGCTGVGPAAETCDQHDNDCDGTVDGFAQDCNVIPGNPNVGLCHPGTRVCPPGGNGTFGTCIGEVGPKTEACNNADDDCDGTVDEDTGGADCSSTCGVGTTVCMNGVITCQGSTGGGPEECNNFDDDCDGVVDEDVPDGGACDGGGTLCNGVLQCMSGNFVCVGDTVRPETCNCDDDDCDGKTDEEPPALCPSGATCTSCQCAFQCSTGEFPCPVGKICDSNNYCINDPCFNVTCDPDISGNKTECKDGACVVSCSLVSCPSGTVCVGATGECAPDDCRTFPERCQANELCVAGVCESNPCAGVVCDADKYCTGGTCVASCADVTCLAGQKCELGACVPNPCAAACFPGQVCHESSGECVNDPCIGRTCPQGQACDSQTGQCGADPCLGVTCPGTGEICKEGSCYDPGQFMPDAGSSTPEYVTAAGGGCATENGSGGAAIVLVGLFLALRPGRRKAGGRS